MNRRVWLWFAWSHKYHFQDSARKIWLILRVDGQSRWKTNEVRCKIYNPSWSLYNKPIGAKGGGESTFPQLWNRLFWKASGIHPAVHPQPHANHSAKLCVTMHPLRESKPGGFCWLSEPSYSLLNNRCSVNFFLLHSAANLRKLEVITIFPIVS